MYACVRMRMRVGACVPRQRGGKRERERGTSAALRPPYQGQVEQGDQGEEARVSVDDDERASAPLVHETRPDAPDHVQVAQDAARHAADHGEVEPEGCPRAEHFGGQQGEVEDAGAVARKDEHDGRHEHRTEEEAEVESEDHSSALLQSVRKSQDARA